MKAIQKTQPLRNVPGLSLSTLVGQLALLLFVAYLKLARATKLCRGWIRARWKALLLVGLGAAAGSLCTAIVGLAVFLGLPPSDAAVLLVGLVVDHGQFFRV